MGEVSREVIIRELRELFREDMAVNDYCIGAERVEAMFRRLLGEPEPVREPVGRVSNLTAEQVDGLLRESYAKVEWPESSVVEWLRRG